MTGSNNTFIGNGADFSTINPTGGNNTLLGADTKVDSSLSNATAIGNRAQVSQNNSLILGGISGVNGGTSTNIGIGTTAPRGRLELSATGMVVSAPRRLRAIGRQLNSPEARPRPINSGYCISARQWARFQPEA